MADGHIWEKYASPKSSVLYDYSLLRPLPRQIYVTKNGFPERGIAGIRAAEVAAREIHAAEIRVAD